MLRRLSVSWLVPDDRGGGVVSVAQACCRQAMLAGHDATLLMLQSPAGHAAEFGDFRVESLRSELPHAEAPRLIVDWLRRNRQDIVVLNACEQADLAIPYIPATTRAVYAVHDTARRYFAAAVRVETALDAIVAVSETVASRFRSSLQDADKLRVVHNGTVFPLPLEAAVSSERDDDLIFLGGDQPGKGAFDVLALWRALQARGFAGGLHWFGTVGDQFRARVARLPGADRITLHGQTLRRPIFEAAARSRVFLMLSRVEPFGMATVECMGMGCLVAAWDIPTGTREIVSAEDGAFAPLGDYEALADSVLALLSTHERRFRISVLRSHGSFDDHAMWMRYSEMFAWLMEREPADRPLCYGSPPLYAPPVRLFQKLPRGLRDSLRAAVGRSPQLGYWLRDQRGR